MDRKALWISAAATVIGFVLLRAYMHRFEERASGGPKARVLALASDVPRGRALTRSLLVERELPDAYRESRHVLARDLERVLGASLAVDAQAGNALLWTDLESLRAPRRTLSMLVPEGLRAMAVQPRGTGLDPLLEPGDRVDVLTAGLRSSAESATQGAATVAQNLLVLAVGTDLGGGDARRRGTGPVTLGVTPEQALRLTQAERAGGVWLVLRNPQDLELATQPLPDAGGAAAAVIAHREAD